jgi:hypothetical protein
MPHTCLCLVLVHEYAHQKARHAFALPKWRLMNFKLEHYPNLVVGQFEKKADSPKLIRPQTGLLTDLHFSQTSA